MNKLKEKKYVARYRENNLDYSILFMILKGSFKKLGIEESFLNILDCVYKLFLNNIRGILFKIKT